MSNTAPSRADPVVVFPLGRWCPPQETSQPHPPPFCLENAFQITIIEQITIIKQIVSHFVHASLFLGTGGMATMSFWYNKDIIIITSCVYWVGPIHWNGNVIILTKILITSRTHDTAWSEVMRKVAQKFDFNLKRHLLSTVWLLWELRKFTLL